MIISFRLSMPNKGSWNGKWTGEGHDYYIIRKFDKNRGTAIMGNDDKKSWYYNFGDGWGALVSAEIIDGIESKKRMKKSIGFLGYDWMVDEIENYGKILTIYERNEKEKHNTYLKQKYI